MSRRYIFGIALLLVAVISFLTTFLQSKDNEVEIPFATPSGESGIILIKIPKFIWTGEKTRLIVKVEFSTPDSGSFPAILIGKLETSMEEVTPRGDVKLGIQSSIPAELIWFIRTDREAQYSGTIFLWLEKGGEKQLLIARDVRVESRLFLGIRILSLRIAAGFLFLIGLLTSVYSMVKRRINLKTNS